MLPSFESELAKADVNYNADRQVHFFRLSHVQYIAFQQMLTVPPPKDKEEASAPTTEPAPVITASLSSREREELRAQLRQRAERVTLSSDYVIKSLRADENNYVRRFVEMVASPNKKHPLRTGVKKAFTVTGRGIHKRKGKSHPAIAPKVPQYSAEEKQGFSKAQSCSYGFAGYSPSVFWFDKRRDKLVGIILNAENFLLSDRLYLYDGGTVGRPYEFDDVESANEYYSKKVGTVLFHRDQLSEFKQALLTNLDKHNEALARLRWGKPTTSRFFIGGDSLAARLWAQDYARIMAAQLIRQGELRENETLPICYYLPDNPDLHLASYTEEEQQLDLQEARAIYDDITQRHHHYQQKNYEILLALPADELEEVFNETYQEQNLVLTILSNGYFHLVESLLEKAEAVGHVNLLEELLRKIKACHDEKLLSRILDHCIARPTVKLATQILLSMPQGVNVRNKDDWTALMYAARCGHTEAVTALLAHPGIEVNGQNKYSWTALMYAARCGTPRRSRPC